MSWDETCHSRRNSFAPPPLWTCWRPLSESSRSPCLLKWHNCPQGGELQQIWLGNPESLIRVPVKGARAADLLRATGCSVQALARKRYCPCGDQILVPMEMLIWAWQPQGKGKGERKTWSWNNLGRKTIGFCISWHRNEWIFIASVKQALNPRTVNGGTDILATVLGFLCGISEQTVPQGFKETCGFLFLFLSKQN